MSLLMVEIIAFDGVYLCLIGNDLPFHKRIAFKRYQNALRNINKVLDNRQLESAAVNLLTETALGKTVAQYLVKSYDDEVPSQNIERTVPEIATTEEHLSQIINQLIKFGDISVASGQETIDVSARQPSLFGIGTYQEDRRPYDDFPVPDNITELRIERSTLGPLIFWALVASQRHGQLLISARKVTEIINKYLVDDHHQKVESSVLRALSSKTLRAQDWLRTEIDRKSGYKLFGIKGDWQIYWDDIFGESS
jgi:hypothetical protein